MADTLRQTDPEQYAAQDRGPSTMAIMISLTTLAAVFVALRLFVRMRMLRNVGLDDYLITTSMIFGIVNVALTSVAISWGSGRHFDTLTRKQQSESIKWTIAAFCPGILSFALPKVGVVALLVKLTEPGPWHRRFLWISSCLTLLVLFGCVIILYAQCTPVQSIWDFDIEGDCISPWALVDYALVSGTMSTAMDFYLAIYPGVVLAKLQMRKRKKLPLIGALGIGIVGGVVAAYKCTRLKGLASPDFTWTTSEIVVWTCAEASTLIIASCIPLMQPILRLIVGKAASSKYRYRSRYSERLEDHQAKGAPPGGNNDCDGIPLSSKPSDLSNAGSTRAFGDSKNDAMFTTTCQAVDDEAGAEDERSIYQPAPWRQSRGHEREGGIQRVDEISVAFEADDGGRIGERRARPVAAPSQGPWRWR